MDPIVCQDDKRSTVQVRSAQSGMNQHTSWKRASEMGRSPPQGSTYSGIYGVWVSRYPSDLGRHRSLEGVGWVNGASPGAVGPGLDKRTGRLSKPVSSSHAQLLHQFLPLGPNPPCNREAPKAPDTAAPVPTSPLPPPLLPTSPSVALMSYKKT